ncbi:hypothetical protein [Micromonospora sp. SH-82]|uniref:hypothetical protein n=1 Tax=Micromonospora sp. SH-82 TaxID=3132938 RepID=UPI003EBA235E
MTIATAVDGEEVAQFTAPSRDLVGIPTRPSPRPNPGPESTDESQTQRADILRRLQGRRG